MAKTVQELRDMLNAHIEARGGFRAFKLPDSGRITAGDINEELGRNYNSYFHLNGTEERALAERTTAGSIISFAAFHGKSAETIYSYTIRRSTSPTDYYYGFWSDASAPFGNLQPRLVSGISSNVTALWAYDNSAQPASDSTRIVFEDLVGARINDSITITDEATDTSYTMQRANDWSTSRADDWPTSQAPTSAYSFESDADNIHSYIVGNNGSSKSIKITYNNGRAQQGDIDSDLNGKSFSFSTDQDNDTAVGDFYPNGNITGDDGAQTLNDTWVSSDTPASFNAEVEKFTLYITSRNSDNAESHYPDFTGPVDWSGSQDGTGPGYIRFYAQARNNSSSTGQWGCRLYNELTGESSTFTVQTYSDRYPDDSLLILTPDDDENDADTSTTD